MGFLHTQTRCLTRLAGDFLRFTQKTAPVAADVIIIEDSAAAYAKKYSTIGAVANIATPVGSGMIWFTNTPPAQYLVCDGSSLLRAGTYADLFAIIGTTYGSVDGTHFTLPDLRQKFPIGKAASGTANTLAATGGAIDHTHTVPAHYHGMGTGADLNITSSGAHSNTLPISTGGGAAIQNFAAQNVNKNADLTIAGDGTHIHNSASFAGRIGLVTGGVDGNAAMTSGTNNPPYLVINYVIRY